MIDISCVHYVTSLFVVEWLRLRNVLVYSGLVLGGLHSPKRRQSPPALVMT